MAVTVVVAGAGIAGLAAAWELSRARVDAIVLEAGRRPGGMIVSERRDGFIVEGGPDGFLAAEPDIQVLAHEAGIGARLVDQLVKGSTQWTGKSLEPLPEGRAAELLGIQTTADEYRFRSFAGGMGEIVDALAAQPPLARMIRPAQGVTGLAPATRGWRLSVTGGSTVEAEAVILALPAWTTARLVAAAGAPGGRHLDDVVYHPSLTVSLAYRAEQLAAPPLGTGFVAAGAWSGAVRACSYSSLKYPNRAPPGHVLLRAFLGPADGDPATLAHTELASILGIEGGGPLWSRAFAWPRGLPRYKPGHAEQVAAVRHELLRLAPLAITGAGFDGAGVSACVQSGREAAKTVIKRLGG